VVREISKQGFFLSDLTLIKFEMSFAFQKIVKRVALFEYLVNLGKIN